MTAAGIKQAIEGRDSRMLSSFYADDALVRVIDRNNPPSKPRDIRGRAAITTFWDDICSRAMTHRVDTTRARGRPDRLHPGLRLPGRHAGVLRGGARASRRADREADRGAGLGRVEPAVASRAALRVRLAGLADLPVA